MISMRILSLGNQMDCMMAIAWRREHSAESEVGMGVHPATYGTRNRSRTPLPPLGNDLRERELFGGVEDAIIEELDSRHSVESTQTNETHDRYSAMAEWFNVKETRRDKNAVLMHYSRQEARGTKEAIRREHLDPTLLTVETTVVRIKDAISSTLPPPKKIGVHKEATIRAGWELGMRRQNSPPRSWKDQTTSLSQGLKLADAKRTR